MGCHPVDCFSFDQKENWMELSNPEYEALQFKASLYSELQVQNGFQAFPLDTECDVISDDSKVIIPYLCYQGLRLTEHLLKASLADIKVIPEWDKIPSRIFLWPVCLPFPEKLSRLPGAERGYRKGIHYGIDIGDFTCGSFGIEVHPISRGIVSAVHLSPAPKTPERSHLAEKSRTLIISTPSDYMLTFKGNFVVIDHGYFLQGYRVYSLYAHLSKVFVTPGKEVTEKDVIGLTGNSGTSDERKECDGSHLHLEVWFQDLITGEEYFLFEGLSPEEIKERRLIETMFRR
jgi:murein DD-endopeptidase MepM/ murein hydrolase activator NlpD